MPESDDDPGLDDARKKKLEAAKAQEQLKTTLRLALDEAAYQRMMNVSVANKEMFYTAAQNVLMLFKRIGRKISEDELVRLLTAIKEKSEKKTTITFHKK